MDTRAITRILLLAGTGSNAEQILNLLRKAGLSIFADRAEDAEELHALASNRCWDLLLVVQETADSPIPALDTLIPPGVDLPALLVSRDDKGSQGLPSMAAYRDVVFLYDADDTHQQLRLSHCVRRELETLQARREKRRVSAAFKELDTRYRLLLESSSDAISYVHEGMHVFANPAWAALFDFSSPADFQGVALLDLVAEADVTAVRDFLRGSASKGKGSCSFEATRRDSSSLQLVIDACAVPYEGEQALQLVARPATGNTAQQNTLRELQEQDLLTGLLNTAGITSRIETAIAQALYHGRSSTLLILQLQHMDEANMVLGRSAVNLLMTDIGSMLQTLLPGDVVAGCLNRDEIILLVPESEERDGDWATRLIESFDKGLRPLLPQTLQLSVKVGTAAVSDEAADAQVVLDRARHNILQRQAGSGQSGTAVSQSTLDSATILKRLRTALGSGNFVLVFQPVVSLQADGLEHYEIRIRMRAANQDDDELIYPPEFLELANQHGLGEEIDRWVLSQALEILKQRKNPRLRFTVNLTQNSITGATLLPWLVTRLHGTRQTAEQLILQISELDIVSAPDRVSVFSRQLEELDIRLSITHFGCSLDPLQNLASVQARFVKLDKALLNDLGVDTLQQKKLKKIVAGLHARELLVIAPMIDHIEMLPLLWQASINMVQGNCLQEPSDDMNFSFTQDEEITLRSFP